MVVLVTCKNEKYHIKNEGARVLTTLYIYFLDAQGQLISEVHGRILPNFELIRTLIVALTS